MDPDLAKLFQLDSSYPGSPLDDVRYYLNYNEAESEEDDPDLEWGREWDRASSQQQHPGAKKRGRKRKIEGSGGGGGSVDPNDPKKTTDVKPEPEDGEFDNEVGL